LAAICSRAIVPLMWEAATAFKARIMLPAALQNFNRLCHFQIGRPPKLAC
jgi:hypothetical protein